MKLNKSLKILCLLCCAAVMGCSSSTSTSQADFVKKYGDFDYCQMDVIKQSQTNSCGVASLTAILNHWDIKTTERQLLVQSGLLRQNGVSIAQLLEIAKSNGLEAYAFSMGPEPIERLTEQIYKGRPVICIVKMPEVLYLGYDMPLFGNTYRWLLWKFGPRKNHSIVVFGTKNKQFLIMDPAYGFTTFSSGHLSDAWGRQNNVVILCARMGE